MLLQDIRTQSPWRAPVYLASVTVVNHSPLADPIRASSSATVNVSRVTAWTFRLFRLLRSGTSWAGDGADHLQITVDGLGRQALANARLLERLDVVGANLAHSFIRPFSKMLEEDADCRAVGDPAVFAEASIRRFLPEPFREPASCSLQRQGPPHRPYQRIVEQFSNAGLVQMPGGGLLFGSFQIQGKFHGLPVAFQLRGLQRTFSCRRPVGNVPVGRIPAGVLMEAGHLPVP
jgi:hypothetical protein